MKYWLASSRSTQDKAHCALFSRCLFHINEEPAYRTFQSSHMCTVGRWWRIYPTSIFLSIIQRWLLIHLAFEDLFVGLPKIFGEKCVYNRVHRRIAVSQAVCSYSEEKGGLSQWENSKFSPEMNHMMRQPRDAKNHHHHQHSLCCLRQGKENTDVWWALEESALNPLQKHFKKEKKQNTRHNERECTLEYLLLILLHYLYGLYFEYWTTARRTLALKMSQ